MAWIFLSGAMLMPSLAPMDKADAALTLGYRTIQVRGRLKSHLENFIREYGEGLDFSAIEENPYADYTCRFYATPEDFGEAMKRAMIGIDYKKFKDTSERKDAEGNFLYEKAKEYHGVLMSIWSATQRLAPAGGFYAPWSEANPRGYRPFRGGRYRSLANRHTVTRGGSTSPLFSDEEFEPDELDREEYANWWEEGDDESDFFEDYTPTRLQRSNDLMLDMLDVPVDQWEDELTEEDFALVKPHMDAARAIQQHRADDSKRAIKNKGKRAKRDRGQRSARFRR